MKNKLILLLAVLFLCSAFKTDKPVITIFMIGDSTMANKSLTGGNPERGWRHILPDFFSEDIQVNNHAMNGCSLKSLIDEGRWDRVLSLIKKGDYVFIRFGHNDEKLSAERHTDPGTTFDANLRKLVNETRAKGGIPVLFNSIVHRKFGISNDKAVAEAILQDDTRKGINPDTKRDVSQDDEVREGDKLIDTHGTYLDSPHNVTEELDVPFIDTNRLTHEPVEGLGPKESKKLFMWVLANTIAPMPKGREDNTRLNVYGVCVIAGITVDTIARAVPELAKYVRHYNFAVAQDGSGNFFTVQEAINAVPDSRKNVRTTILIRKSVYKGKLIMLESKINISLIGQEGAVISYNDYAGKPDIFGENKGTSGSSSCYIYAPDFCAENITFENTPGPVGQAAACFISADRMHLKNCRFLGFRDTLYTYGKGMRQYYESCYIEGTVDFVLGWPMTVFSRRHIHSKRDGYVTAPSIDEGQKYSYVFYDCKLTTDTGVTKVYLSCPWRPFARAVFVHCDLGKHILPAEWHNWDRKETEKIAFYAEYDSYGPGANPKARAAFSHQSGDLKGHEMESVLSGSDNWDPVANGNVLVSIKR